jgi:hypothetical protein
VLPPRGKDAATQDRNRVLQVLRAQGVTVATPVGTDVYYMKRGNRILVQHFPDRVPNAVLALLGRTFEFDFMRFYFEQIEADLPQGPPELPFDPK